MEYFHTLAVILLGIAIQISTGAFLKKPSSRVKIVTYDEDTFPNNGFELTTSNKRINNTGRKVLACYYNVPNMHDTPFPVFPEQIDPFLCTHIMIAFGNVDNYTLVPGDIRDFEFYNRTVKLKLKNPELKVLISVGGASGSKKKNGFDDMMASSTTRTKFIINAISFMNTYGFNGMDLDWEFPHSYQRNYLSDFLKEFRDYVKQNTSTEYLLTAAVGARKNTIDISYDIPTLAKYLDFINLMTYDFHYYSPMTPLTGPTSPLNHIEFERGYLSTMNAAWAANYWYQNGMPANKILLGLPTYGRTFELVDEKYNTYYSLALGVASVGSSNGYISYSQACKFSTQTGTKVVFDKDARESYAYNGRDWITFANEQSTKDKVEFVTKMGYLGVSVYSINSDDAWKLCSGSKTVFPIVQTAKDTLNYLA